MFTLQSAEVPKLFKHGGKIRNKNMSKRDTEKLVKEIWKERRRTQVGAHVSCNMVPCPLSEAQVGLFAGGQAATGAAGKAALATQVSRLSLQSPPTSLRSNTLTFAP